MLRQWFTPHWSGLSALGGGAMPDGDHLLIGLHHPHGAAMTRFKRETNLQGWDGCSTRHDGLLAAVMSDSQEAAPSGVGPPETRHHSQVEVVSVEYSSRTLPKSWQLCRKCTDTTLGRAAEAFMEFPIFPIPSFQHLCADSEQLYIINLLLQPLPKYFMVDVVKEAFDIKLNEPCRSSPLMVDLIQCCVT